MNCESCLDKICLTLTPPRPCKEIEKLLPKPRTGEHKRINGRNYYEIPKGLKLDYFFRKHLNNTPSLEDLININERLNEI